MEPEGSLPCSQVPIMSKMRSFHGGKTAGAWSWPLTSF